MAPELKSQWVDKMGFKLVILKFNISWFKNYKLKAKINNLTQDVHNCSDVQQTLDELYIELRTGTSGSLPHCKGRKTNSERNLAIFRKK